MSGIIPIPTTRISTALITQRLTQQVQNDQIDLFRLQSQISTGQRIFLPSEDAPAALRAIGLQRLLERKGQLESNISSGQVYLAATDTALSEIADALNQIKSSTLGVVGTVSTPEDRVNAIAQIDQTLENLIALANRQIQGRYLFSGSQTSEKPYGYEGTNVVYHGDEAPVRSYSDLGLLFSTNATGQEVFGGISEEVSGTVDLNPEVNADTQLNSLRGGRGLKPNGAISISDGTNTSIIDISNAATIGDVIRLIEENPPTNQAVEVQLTGTGLKLQFAPGSSSGNNIIINEVGNGSTARELGILQEQSGGITEVVGEDLNPKLLLTTSVEDILGSKARTVIESGTANDNADILLTAGANGIALNGVTVQFVDDALLTALPGVSVGSEVVEYDQNDRAAQAAITFSGANNDLILKANAPGADFNNVRIDVSYTATGGVPTANYDTANKILSINLESNGNSDANDVITAIDNLLGNPFTASLDTSLEISNDGTGTIASVSQSGFANTGNSGGAAKTLYVRIDPGDSSANDVVNAINAEGTFTAEIDPSDTSSTLFAGTGKVVLNSSVAPTSGGAGAAFDQNSGIRVTNGGETYDLKFSTAETVEDILNTINAAGAGLVAEINADGSGINVRSRLSGNPLQIGEVNGGLTATQLGLRTFNSSTKLSDLNYGVGVPTGDGFDLPTADGDDLTISTIDNQQFKVDLNGSTSINDVVTAINNVTGGSVTASAVSTGNVTVVQLVDNSVSGTEKFTITQEAGSLAAQYLGLVPNDGATQNVSNSATVVGSDSRYTDLTITAKDGQTYSVDLSAATTVGEAIAEINKINPDINSPEVLARLAASGNGIELVDSTGGSAAQLTVTAREGSQAAEFLGLVPKGQTTNATSSVVLTGDDRNYLETESVFNTLLSLRKALENDDLPAIERAAEHIDVDISRVTSSRAEVGARGRGLDLSLSSLQEEVIQLKGTLSEEIDVDLVAAISEFTARQTALQASLQVSANLMKLSLLDFI